MTKKQILKILRDYEEDEQIFCIWWDKDCFEHLDMTDEEWVKVVHGLDEYSFEDMNTTSPSFGQDVWHPVYSDHITLHYFSSQG